MELVITKENQNELVQALNERMNTVSNPNGRVLDKFYFDYLTQEDIDLINNMNLKDVEMLYFKNTKWSKFSPYVFKFQ